MMMVKMKMIIVETQQAQCHYDEEVEKVLGDLIIDDEKTFLLLLFIYQHY